MTIFSELSKGMADAVEAASESVVQVRAARPVSGTVVGDGLILTAAHVLPTDDVTVVTAGGVRWGRWWRGVTRRRIWRCCACRA
ncbi:hypothetical protein [Deinococcus aquaticus]|uniref:hypothetical protein n=1 Tax=Deinococcus aquaticus TaxID=328692 RepID=UPI003620FA8B